MTAPWWQRWLGPTTIFFCAVALIGGGLFAFLLTTQRAIRDEAALEIARSYSSTLRQLQQFYASEVLSHIDPDQIDVSHEYRTAPHAVPLPATLTIDFADFITQDTPGLQAAMRSDHPFPWRMATPLTDFEARALAFLRSSGQDDTAEFETSAQGQRMLRYAAPIRMSESCVACHNAHPQSSRRDWTVGDVRGIHVIEAPVALLGAQVPTPYRILLVAVAVTALLAGGLIAWARSRELSALDGLAARNLDLERANAEKDAANRAKSAFLATISHEIRTPMNGILGLAEILKQDARTAEDRGRVSQIQTAGNSLLRVINDVLDFSSMDARTLDIETTAFAPDALADQVLSLFVQPKPGASVELLVTLDAGLPERLLGDALRISQVLTNLVGNALKFTQTGEVILSIRRDPADPAWVLFEVSDTGTGIRTEQMEHLVQPFAQADNSDTRRHEGAGLGLAIARNLAEQMGGRLDVQSTWGKGSLFALALPLVPATTDQPVTPPELPEDLDRVVLWAPHAGTRAVFADTLENTGLDVITAQSAAEAQARMQDALSSSVLLAAAPVAQDASAPVSLDALDQDIAARTLHLVARGQPGDPMSRHTIMHPVLPRALLQKLAELGTALAAPRDDVGDLQESSGKPAADDTLDGLRVLVVDDNDLNRIVTKGFLERSKAQVTLAGSGAAALRLVGLQTFDVVLMDIQMPDMDGYETTRALRELGHMMPVIAVTAAATTADYQRSADEGLQGHLAKPLSRPRLVEALLGLSNLDWSMPNTIVRGSLRAALEALGLDTERGIRLNGETEADYARALVQFARTDAGLPMQLAEALAAQDLATAERFAQTTKSLLFLIGADPLAKHARSIAQTLRQGEFPDDASVARLSQEYARIVRTILDNAPPHS